VTHAVPPCPADALCAAVARHLDTGPAVALAGELPAVLRALRDVERHAAAAVLAVGRPAPAVAAGRPLVDLADDGRGELAAALAQLDVRAAVLAAADLPRVELRAVVDALALAERAVDEAAAAAGTPPPGTTARGLAQWFASGARLEPPPFDPGPLAGRVVRGAAWWRSVRYPTAHRLRPVRAGVFKSLCGLADGYAGNWREARAAERRCRLCAELARYYAARKAPQSRSAPALPETRPDPAAGQRGAVACDGDAAAADPSAVRPPSDPAPSPGERTCRR